MPSSVPVCRRLMPLAVAFALALSATAAGAQQFTYSDKANQELAKRLNIPVYFTVPSSAYATLPAQIKTSDRLILFKHPDANGADVGLRVMVAKRDGLARRLGKSGLLQTGDLMLTFRAEWGGAGAYPDVQMGISHTGIAYIKDGVLHNLDNPMDEVYLGKGYRSDLTSEHYRTLSLIHIIRPRGLTDQQRANLYEWITRLAGSASKVYPKEIAFNSDYNAPKFRSGRPLTFVQQLGQIALGQDPPGKVDMYCSEFAWSVLSLRDCDPKATGDLFKGSSVPSCVKPPMTPMPATGSIIGSLGSGKAGLADGPLMVINTLGLPADAKRKLIHSVFLENPAGLAKLSSGHQAVAKQFQSDFSKLETYYLGMSGGTVLEKAQASYISFRFGNAIPQNYSPTSYLINTLLAPNNPNRTMDYVATVLIE